MGRIVSVLMSLLSGILMGCTVAPLEWWGLGWFALAPLWWLIGQKNTPAWRLGAAWGAGFHGTAMFWITGVHPMTWMGVPWLASLAIAIACWLFIIVWGGLLVALWAHLQQWSPKPWGARILMGVASWCLLEVLWRSLPLWWSSLAYSQSPHNLPILHLGQLSGTTTITAVLVAVNGCWAAAFDSFDLSRQKVRLPAILAAVILLGLSQGLGGYLYSRPLNDDLEQRLTVGIIQGNIPNEIKLYPEGLRQALEGYTRGYEELSDAGVDVVMTPETALPVLWQGDRLQYSNSPAGHFYQALRDRGVPAWLGTSRGTPSHYTNSLLSLSGTGETLSYYDKAILVPLGEYIPFESVLGGVISRLSPLQAQMIPGSGDQLLQTPFGPAIVSICYESAFPQHLQAQAQRGGEFFLSAANNAHYAPSMPRQHHAQDVMRAIELDRWAVRATNTGYSAFVNPHGETLWISPINQYATHSERIYRRQRQTLYVRWGDWLVWLLILASLPSLWPRSKKPLT
ncbi:MAG: apolipoprotein N-acyltransferase Int [Phormidium sp. OSCR]|nr:MAG: apolipoprotein N-acyltransferase Int [Phormidium sp. OSCR]